MDEQENAHLVWVARLKKQYGPPSGPTYGPSSTPILVPADLAAKLGLPIVEKPRPVNLTRDTQ